MKIRESAKEYLEAIYVLQEQNGFVRSIDIAGYLNVSKPSVSRAMGVLRKNGYIHMDENSQIHFQPAGLEIAHRIYDRHRILTAYLIRLGVAPQTAAADACRIEHILSEEAFLKIKKSVISNTSFPT